MRETQRELSLVGLNGLRERRVSGPVRGSVGVDPEDLARRELKSLTALANRYSLNSDDADEAVQRGLEILLRRAESLEPETAAAWLRTVVKHEAFAVRAERQRVTPTDPDDLGVYADRRDLAETADLMDRLSVASEAMSLIKPREAEALLLQAEGLTYKDIAQEKGWSYTKVNRLINEGAKAFRGRVDAIDSGLACSDVPKGANGEVSTSHRRHLLRCPACRAEFREGRGRTALPVLAIPLLFELPARLLRAGRHVLSSTSDRIVGGAVKAQSAVEAVSTGKVVAVAASAAALASGGVAVTHSDRHGTEPPRNVEAKHSRTSSLAGPSSIPEAPTSNTETPSTKSDSGTKPVTTIAAHEAPASEFGPGGSDSPKAVASSRSAAPASKSSRSAPQPTPVPEFGP